MRRKRPQAFTKPQLNGGVRESDVITALRGALGFYEGLQVPFDCVHALMRLFSRGDRVWRACPHRRSVLSTGSVRPSGR